MKLQVWMHLVNSGDGGAYVKFFNTKEDAEFSADQDDERFCDDVQTHTFEFDDYGKLLNPDLVCSSCGQDIL